MVGGLAQALLPAGGVTFMKLMYASMKNFDSARWCGRGLEGSRQGVKGFRRWRSLVKEGVRNKLGGGGMDSRSLEGMTGGVTWEVYGKDGPKFRRRVFLDGPAVCGHDRAGDVRPSPMLPGRLLFWGSRDAHAPADRILSPPHWPGSVVHHCGLRAECQNLQPSR